jgi:hypothetical protein
MLFDFGMSWSLVLIYCSFILFVVDVIGFDTLFYLVDIVFY